MSELDYTHPINLENEEEGQLSIDVYQTENRVVVISTVSGVTMDDLEILVHVDMLIIRGRRLPPEAVKPEQYLYRDCYWGPFSRTIILPRDVDLSQIKASIKNGILMISLPRVQGEAFKKISVET
ncbi:MAG: Hsp20/alpha crystallin family protein [Patescibacteria group bacterium]|nr:Hsp20/alpha crystallin family protein [Patescibacteria group bacterium]MCL5257905.1 Hsp20/alpha crystallin family protein [Patescibacteria group bacterium]